jgi:hypothetical protein
MKSEITCVCVAIKFFTTWIYDTTKLGFSGALRVQAPMHWNQLHHYAPDRACAALSIHHGREMRELEAPKKGRNTDHGFKRHIGEIELPEGRN